MPEGDVALWRRIRRRWYWLLALFLLGVARVLPLSWGRAIGEWLALLGLRLRPRDLQIADSNLALAFPRASDEERTILIRRAAVATGRNLWDTLAVPKVLAAGLVTEEPCPETGGRSVLEVLDELAARGHGVIILTGHLGCWELLGGWLGSHLPTRGLGPLGVVTGRIHNPAVDRLLQTRRRDLGLVPLPRQEGARPLLRHLNAGRVAALLLDQNVRARTLDVPFFGRPAPTAAGLGTIALRYGIPVLPVVIARDPRGRGHLVRHLPPIEKGPGGQTDVEVGAFLGRCNEALEELIRRNPEEWVWFHRRWPA
jgi:KDO2-lipid IV(A) lauroyltransferase